MNVKNRNSTRADAGLPLTRIGKLFIAIFLIATFEGAIRKWVSKDLTYGVIALRDIVAMYGIWSSVATGRFRQMAPSITEAVTIFSVVIAAWGMLALVINQRSLIIYIFGIRFWLLYLWFGVFAGALMNTSDFKAILKMLQMLVVAMTPLVVVQHFLPSSSFLNKQVDEGLIFVVAGDIVRTTGTFSFTFGYTVFLAIVTPTIFATMLARTPLWDNKWMPLIVFPSVLISTIVSGSRSSVLLFGILYLAYAWFSVFYSKGKRNLKAMAIIVGTIVAILAFLSIFTGAVEATRERFEGAAESESFTTRLMYNFGLNQESSFIGHGLGTGSNFAQMTEKDTVGYEAESETGRMLFEIGMLGFVVLIVKFGILYIATRKAFRIAKVTGQIGSLLVWISLINALLQWSIIGQLTANVFGYLLLGLGIATLRFEAANYPR